MVPDTLDAGIRVDHVDRRPFADRIGGTFGHAGTARNALFRDFHCHGWILQKCDVCLLYRDLGESSKKAQAHCQISRLIFIVRNLRRFALPDSQEMNTPR